MSKKYSLKIETVGKTYEAKGDTPLEALLSIPKPLKVMYRGIVTLSQGDKKVETIMWPVRLKRLFYNKLFQQVQMNKLCNLMK